MCVTATQRIYATSSLWSEPKTLGNICCTKPWGFTTAFAMDLCLNVFCHIPAAQFGGTDMPNEVVSELTPEKMIQHGLDPIKQPSAKYPIPGSDVYKCLKWVGAHIDEMTSEIAAGDIKEQVHALTTQAKFCKGLGIPPHINLHYPRQRKTSHPPKPNQPAKPNKPPHQQKAVSKPLPFNQQHAHQRTTRATMRANRGNNQADNATTPKQMERTTTQATKGNHSKPCSGSIIHVLQCYINPYHLQVIQRA